MATAAAEKPFNRDLFCKLVLLMDSTNEFERKRAEGKAVEMCVARSVRFCDMVAHNFGQGGKRVAELEAELENARRGGDELADELRRKDAVIKEYRKAGSTKQRWCRSCETMRRITAVTLGGAILAGWFYEYPPHQVTHRWSGYGLLLGVAPLLGLFIRWRVMAFGRKHHWVTWRDNDVFRAVAHSWNGFLRRFVIEA